MKSKIEHYWEIKFDVSYYKFKDICGQTVIDSDTELITIYCLQLYNNLVKFDETGTTLFYFSIAFVFSFTLSALSCTVVFTALVIDNTRVINVILKIINISPGNY